MMSKLYAAYLIIPLIPTAIHAAIFAAPRSQIMEKSQNLTIDISDDSEGYVRSVQDQKSGKKAAADAAEEKENSKLKPTNKWNVIDDYNQFYDDLGIQNYRKRMAGKTLKEYQNIVANRDALWDMIDGSEVPKSRPDTEVQVEDFETSSRGETTKKTNKVNDQIVQENDTSKHASNREKDFFTNLTIQEKKLYIQKSYKDILKRIKPILKRVHNEQEDSELESDSEYSNTETDRHNDSHMHYNDNYRYEQELKEQEDLESEYLYEMNTVHEMNTVAVNERKRGKVLSLKM